MAVQQQQAEAQGLDQEATQPEWIVWEQREREIASITLLMQPGYGR